MLIDTVFHKEDDIGGAIWLQADVPIVGVGGMFEPLLYLQIQIWWSLH